MSPRMWVWCVKWHNECYRSEPDVNVVAPDIQGAIIEGTRWLNQESNSDLSPEDCTLVSVIRGVELEA